MNHVSRLTTLVFAFAFNFVLAFAFCFFVHTINRSQMRSSSLFSLSAVRTHLVPRSHLSSRTLRFTHLNAVPTSPPKRSAALFHPSSSFQLAKVCIHLSPLSRHLPRLTVVDFYLLPLFLDPRGNAETCVLSVCLSAKRLISFLQLLSSLPSLLFLYLLTQLLGSGSRSVQLLAPFSLVDTPPVRLQIPLLLPSLLS